jgi:hypothetical protein
MTLTIRDQQLRALGEHTADTFERKLMQHLREFFPGQTAAMDEAALRAVVEYGVARAGTYGIDAKRDLCKYLNLMFVFGRDFDVDPRFPWTRQSLDNMEIGPTLKLNRLYLDAREHEHEGTGLA